MRSRRGGQRSVCPKPGHKTIQVGRAACGADGALVFAGSASLSPSFQPVRSTVVKGLRGLPCAHCPTGPRCCADGLCARDQAGQERAAEEGQVWAQPWLRALLCLPACA